ncbi:uncharacterized protein PV09_06576 [Verruconis gallopava]|uniref:Uncharacterized protein n=1 Tax=Verruconis gallopava TaxID=253628 RepID=A0A0D2A5T2_9PEZI|nr:uncharacterized protein PV09_06576 [Verruconis gallopava]KIW02083.1 hypothetical protein PV09_06576 [Verruconis gallopava]
MEQNPLVRRGVGLRGVDHSAVSPGYALFTHLTSTGIVRLVDNDGNEVHKWSLPFRPGRHARLLRNGNLAYNGVHPDGPHLYPMWQKYRGGVMMEVAPDGKVVSEYRDPLAHHDQNHLDDGTLLYTTLEPMTEEEASSVVGGIPGSEAYDGKIYADVIKLVDPKTGELLWKWRVAEGLDRTKFPLQPIYAREHYPLINSVSILRDGNILASLRSVSAVIIINRKTGEIMWHLDSTVVAQQHCANELENGNILIFDNGALRHGTSAVYSRVIEVDRQTKQIVWQYTDRVFPMAFFTPFMGSAQRLKNGNTFVCEAAFGRMFEVTRDGRIVWEYINPHLASYNGLDAKELEDIGFDYPSNALFRAYKYSPDEVPWLSLPSPAATP